MKAKTLIFVMMLLAMLSACKKKDTTVPQIWLNGDAIMYLHLNDTFIDPGADATDEGGNLSSIQITGTVNTDFEGNYSIKYRAFDTEGNSSEVTRIVNVQNAATPFKGNYQTSSWTPSDTIHFQTVVNTSTTVNYRIWLVGYAKLVNAVVYADYSNDSLHIPEQTVMISGTQHFLKGEGLLTDSILSIFNIDYTDSVSGSLETGSSLLQKIQ